MTSSQTTENPTLLITRARANRLQPLHNSSAQHDSTCAAVCLLLAPALYTSVSVTQCSRGMCGVLKFMPFLFTMFCLFSSARIHHKCHSRLATWLAFQWLSISKSLTANVFQAFEPNEVGVHAHSCRIHPVPGRSFVVCFEANHSILICMYKCSLNCRQPGCEWYVPNSLF